MAQAVICGRFGQRWRHYFARAAQAAESESTFSDRVYSRYENDLQDIPD